MNIQFDLNEINKNQNPEVIFANKVGIVHKKRVVVQRSSIDWSGSKWQIREGVYDEKNVIEIVSSLKAYGYLPTEKPQVVIRAPAGHLTEFIGIAGFNRDAAQKLLGWTTTVVDVVEYKNPIDLRIFSHRTNHQKTPSAPCTTGDFVKSVEAAIESNEIGRTEKEVIALVEAIVEPHRKSVIKAVIKTVISNIEYGNTLHRPFDGALANKFAKDRFEIDTGKKHCAFIRPNGVSKTTFFDGMKASLAFSSDITIYGYIDQPKPATLNKKRQVWMNEFTSLGKFWQDVVQAGSGTRPPVENCPFVFGGFLPQNETPDPSKGGSPTETELVLI
jgi:hypothetical protein